MRVTKQQPSFFAIKKKRIEMLTAPGGSCQIHKRTILNNMIIALASLEIFFKICYNVLTVN